MIDRSINQSQASSSELQNFQANKKLGEFNLFTLYYLLILFISFKN